MNEIINLGNGQFIKVTMFKGERGSNIATITKTGTSGLVDTYTITLTDGSTTSFEVKNGSSIDHITKTSSVGSVDTYTIYLTDGTVGGTFEVNNAIATVEQNFSSTSTNPLMNKTLTNIIAGVENGSTASKTYYANDLILRNDSLYEVSTTVAVGSAWADGVNISETTLGDLVSQINADLTDNNKSFKFGYQNGQYGYYKQEGGADTFVPFSPTNTQTVTETFGVNWSGRQVTYTFSNLSKVIGVVNISGASAVGFYGNPSMTIEDNRITFNVTRSASGTVINETMSVTAIGF